jgi:hypothetical protein
MTPTRQPRFTASRFGIVVAAVIGFGIGATGFAAAQQGDSPEPVEQPVATSSPTTTVADAPTTTNEAAPTTTVDDNPITRVGDGPMTTVEDRPTTTVDDNPTTTVDDSPTTTVDDNPTTRVDDGPTTTVDDGPTTTVEDSPTSTVEDSPTSTAPTALPAPFTTSYASAGGSISISWSGTAFTLNGVTPAPGFRAEIEHQSWDRVRVDFEGEDRDARIEVRIDDGQLRVGID